MHVRDGMNEIVVTVAPQHTLREAAHRMTERDVGAAVVVDPEGQGPGIITERDLLRSVGSGQDPDTELVGEHLGDHMIYAAPDWSLERAAQEMTHGAFRHVIVLDHHGEAVGILSMRDIVRVWFTVGATSEMPDRTPEPAWDAVGLGLA